MDWKTYLSLKMSTWTIFNLFTVIALLGCYILFQQNNQHQFKVVQVIKAPVQSEWIMKDSDFDRYIPKQKVKLVIQRSIK